MTTHIKALSIRQPWAWLIVHGHKDVENRSWPTSYRGPFLVHAGKGMTRDEYEECAAMASELGVSIPAFADLQRGGIVGRANIAGCVTDSPSKWFSGKYGFVLQDAEPIPFVPAHGELGFFVPRQQLESK